jgi:hypothetical protein
MSRQRDSLATRRAIYADHGGEMRFWLGWVRGEIDGATQDWFRARARHDPALRDDLASVDDPAARRDVDHALEATAYLAPRAATAASGPALVEDLDDVTNFVLPGRRARRAPAAAAARLPAPGRAAARVRGAVYALAHFPEAPEPPRLVLQQALGQLTEDERHLLFAQWQGREGYKESFLRVLLPEDNQPPTRGELSDSARRLRRAEGHLRQALGDRRELLKALGPEQVRQILSEEYLGPATNGPAPAPAAGRASRKKRRSAGETEVYRRVGRSLFKLLAEVEIPLPARDEAGEATRLLQHLVGREAVGHFRELAGWLHETRARLDLAGHPEFYAARDRLLLWLAPDCFVTDGRRPHFELSFRLYLRARLKDHCRDKSWRPAGARYRDLETALRALDRQRIGDLVREAVEEAARADAAPALAGVPLAQALQWLQVAP